MDENQKEQFREALEDKEARARERAKAESAEAHEEQLMGTDQTQETLSVRAKNSGHGKKTADKWNQ